MRQFDLSRILLNDHFTRAKPHEMTKGLEASIESFVSSVFPMSWQVLCLCNHSLHPHVSHLCLITPPSLYVYMHLSFHLVLFVPCALHALFQPFSSVFVCVFGLFILPQLLDVLDWHAGFDPCQPDLPFCFTDHSETTLPAAPLFGSKPFLTVSGTGLDKSSATQM